MRTRVILKFAALLLVLSASVWSAGCLDIHSTRGIFFPTDEKEVQYEQGTIAEVRHNFTGGIGENSQVLTQEEHLSIDNFHIGRGGADLYIWAQVHFGADTERRIDYTRSVEVTLYYMPEGGEPILRARDVYTAKETGRYDIAKMLDQIEDAEPGLWSLRAHGTGTASETADVPFYDWYQVTVNGRYSSDSYNNNAPPL
ncbi:MAG: hypothetical protein ACMUIE_01715 [Thermoplasmatota archaeon]